MVTLKLFLVVVLAQHVVSDGDSHQPVIDPLIVPSIKVIAPNDAGINIEYKNLNITGMEEKQWKDSEINLINKWVWKKYKVKLHVVGDITFELSKEKKSFSGGYTLVTDITESFNYTFEFKLDNLGYKRTHILDVTFNCDDIGEPQITISPELAKALENDPAAVNLKPKLEDLTNLREAMICRIGEVTFGALVDSYRVLALGSPTNAILEQH